jgi:ATP-dependent exoDNAse (exonuclease V) beta subunit
MPEAWQVLAVRNRHPRDQHIVFDEPTHVYTVKGSNKGYVSVTKFLHCFFPPFNADKIIAKMMASPRWHESKYFGKAAEEIKAEWNASGSAASSAGTKMHLAIEQFLNEAEHLIPDDVRTTTEWSHFMRFWAKHGTDLEPYRLEWEVYVEEIKLAGSIDGVFRRKSDGAFFIYDWKRSKEIKTENPFDHGYAPVDHLPDTNYWHYSLQLNTYRYILENYYGLRIEGMYLVFLHPDFPSFKRVEVSRMEEETEAMIETRRRAVAAGCRQTVVLP